MIRVVNYEDRDDLLMPAKVVAPSLLARLGSVDGQARATFEVDALAAGSGSISSVAYEAIRTRIQLDTGEEQGAPPEAAALEEDAMVCGYAFGSLALGPMGNKRIVPLRDLLARVESMYLYALPGQAGPRAIREILARTVAAPTAAHEEALGWAWAFGLGVAVVEADLAWNDG